MSTLWDTIKKGLADSAKIAKEGAQIAAEKAEELGKKSKIMIEINRTKRKIEKNFTEIGGKVYHNIMEEKDKDVAGNAEIKTLLEDVLNLENDLNDKQVELDNIGVYKEEKVTEEAEVVETKKSDWLTIRI